MTRIPALALPLLLAACVHGTAPTAYPVAMTPAGARVVVRLYGEEKWQRGELFAVDTQGVFVRTKQLTRARWSSIAAIDVDDRGGDYDIGRDTKVDPAHLKRLAMISRFPQGLDGPLLDRVLAALGQTVLWEVP